MPVEPVAIEEPRPVAAPDRRRLVEAYQLGRAIFAPGRDLRARVGADWSIEWQFGPGGGPLPTEAERVEIERLKPEFLEELRGRNVRVPRPSATTAPKSEGGPTRACRVPRDVQADVKSHLGRLTSPETTNADVLATARALAAVLGPHRDEEATERKFFQWCGQARSGRGSMSLAILIDAFEGACGKSPERRGAVFVHLIKLFTEQARRRGLPPA